MIVGGVFAEQGTESISQFSDLISSYYYLFKSCFLAQILVAAIGCAVGFVFFVVETESAGGSHFVRSSLRLAFRDRLTLPPLPALHRESPMR